jgi:hypothetical protein
MSPHNELIMNEVMNEAMNEVHQPWVCVRNLHKQSPAEQNLHEVGRFPNFARKRGNLTQIISKAGLIIF